MADNVDFPAVFERLKNLFKPYEEHLLVKADRPGDYFLDTPYSSRYMKELFFGAVQIKKNYVSFYLMPIYMYPGLLDGLSASLRKRMQGKSCFNFKSIDEPILEELAQLTREGFETFRREGLV